MTFTNEQLQYHVKSGKVCHPKWYYRPPAKPLVCLDGFTVSVQASLGHYCSPQNNEGPYFTFELGFPSEKQEELMSYAEDETDPTGTVYSQVPLSIILSILNQHVVDTSKLDYNKVD
jgi:hypothetical protein